MPHRAALQGGSSPGPVAQNWDREGKTSPTDFINGLNVLRELHGARLGALGWDHRELAEGVPGISGKNSFLGYLEFCPLQSCRVLQLHEKRVQPCEGQALFPGNKRKWPRGVPGEV